VSERVKYDMCSGRNVVIVYLVLGIEYLRNFFSTSMGCALVTCSGLAVKDVSVYIAPRLRDHFLALFAPVKFSTVSG
jgi:hypothetical protein